jgi:hypothetical protein
MPEGFFLGQLIRIKIRRNSAWPEQIRRNQAKSRRDPAWPDLFRASGSRSEQVLAGAPGTGGRADTRTSRPDRSSGRGIGQIEAVRARPRQPTGPIPEAPDGSGTGPRPSGMRPEVECGDGATGSRSDRSRREGNGRPRQEVTAGGRYKCSDGRSQRQRRRATARRQATSRQRRPERDWGSETARVARAKKNPIALKPS